MTLALPPDHEWLTAAEAAAEALPGFCYSKSQINRVITESNIETRKRAGKGGGREFHYTSLPAEAQAEYLRRYGKTSTALITDDRTSRIGEKTLRAQARAAIVDAALAMVPARGGIGKALKTFSKLYRARRAKLESWVYEAQPSADPDQVRAWRRALDRDGLDGLVDGRGRPNGTSAIGCDVELRNFLGALIAARPNLPVFSVKNDASIKNAIALPREQGGLGREIPARTLQAYVRPLRPQRNALVKALANPGGFNSAHRPALGSLSQDVLRINQRWALDATIGDCMCIVRDEYGRESERRFALTMVIDIFTRRACIVVSDAPGGAATRALFRRAILKWGIPEEIKTDNGKEFANYAVQRFMREMEIAANYCRKFSPWEKAHVERMFKTILHGLFVGLPGFVGHNIPERQAIESRIEFKRKFGMERRVLFDVKLSPADLQARIDAWMETMYEPAQHEGIGMSPAMKAKLHEAEARHVEDPRILDALMMDQSIRTISKGKVRLANRFYGSVETGALEVTQPQSRVAVRIDPLDPSWIAVYTADGNSFLTVARDLELLEAPERQRVAGQAIANQNKVVALYQRNAQALRPTPNLVDALLIEAGADLELKDDARTAMIRAAAPRFAKHVRMLEARDCIDDMLAPIDPTDTEREGAAAMLAAMAPPIATPGIVQCVGYARPFFEDDMDFYRWAAAHEAAGGKLDDEDVKYRKELLAGDAFRLRLEVEQRDGLSRRDVA